MQGGLLTRLPLRLGVNKLRTPGGPRLPPPWRPLSGQPDLEGGPAKWSRWRSPHSSTDWWFSTVKVRCSAQPNYGTTPSRPKTPTASWPDLALPSGPKPAGASPYAAFTIAKLSWLRRCEPDTFARIGHVLLPHDWLTYCLTGRFVTDRGDASGTGYWSPKRDKYRTDLLELVDRDTDWASVLPTVLGPWDQAGSLTAEAAAALGLPVGTPVAAGTGDNMAGALGTGLRPGEVAISIGTSGTVFAQSEQPVQDPTGAIAGFADATGHYLPLVCTLNATLVTAAISRLLSVDHSGLDDLALAAPSGCDGLVLVPYLVGERTPNRPDATGTLSGIRSGVSRELLARAAFEGVVCSLLEGLDALEAAGVPTRVGRLVLLGGGARSSAYRQILATLAGRPVTVPYDNEIVTAGAAVQAAVLATGSDPTEVAEAWALRAGETTAPGASSVTSEEVRSRFVEARG